MASSSRFRPRHAVAHTRTSRTDPSPFHTFVGEWGVDGKLSGHAAFTTPLRVDPDQAAAEVNALKSPTKLREGVEGTVAFKSQMFTNYRYRITAKDDSLWIWLEDIKSKKQWQTEALKLDDFISKDSVIPMAKFHDYAVCFANCLQNTESSDFESDLTAVEADPDAWALTLTLKLRVSVTEWKPTYKMLLKPIALEPTDMLAAKIRDQEDQIQRLENEVMRLAAKTEAPTVTPPAYVTGRTTQRAGTNQNIVWNQDEGAGNLAVIFGSEGGIRFTVAATFVVHVTVQHQNTSNNTITVELLINGKVANSCKDSNPNPHVQVTPLCHVLATKTGDELKVVYTGNNQALEGSQIVIYQLR